MLADYWQSARAQRTVKFRTAVGQVVVSSLRVRQFLWIKHGGDHRFVPLSQCYLLAIWRCDAALAAVMKRLVPSMCLSGTRWWSCSLRIRS